MIRIYHQGIGGVWYAAATDDETVFATAFSRDERDVLRRLLENLPYNAPFEMAEKATRSSWLLLATLKEVRDGKGASANFKLACDHLSNYTRRVLDCVSLIPVGYVTTYGAIAKAVGGSPRAVGRAVATNPFPPLIPCHRVVRGDLDVGGYGLGKEIKREILRREDRKHGDSCEMRVGGKVLPLFPVKFLQK